MALYGIVWHCMALYGLKWNFMVLYGRLSSFLAVIDPNSFGLVYRAHSVFKTMNCIVFSLHKCI